LKRAIGATDGVTDKGVADYQNTPFI
jgi:hypothetical protein